MSEKKLKENSFNARSAKQHGHFDNFQDQEGGREKRSGDGGASCTYSASSSEMPCLGFFPYFDGGDCGRKLAWEGRWCGWRGCMCGGMNDVWVSG